MPMGQPPQPQGAPPQPGPQGPTPGGPPPQSQGPNPAQAAQMVQSGYQVLSKAVGMPGADPQLKQLLGQAVNAFQAFIAEAEKPHGAPAQAPQGPQPKGPMPAMANQGAKPAPSY